MGAIYSTNHLQIGDLESTFPTVTPISERAQGASEKSKILESARRLESMGHVDKALDMIFTHFDTLFRHSDYKGIDLLLSSVDPKSFGTDLLLGFLTITLPGKNRLASRSPLFGRIDLELRSRTDWNEELLSGLEP